MIETSQFASTFPNPREGGEVSVLRSSSHFAVARAIDVYRTSNGSVTKRFYAALVARGVWGELAAALFKAQKASKRAKKYGPYAGNGAGSYRDLSYQRKGEALKHLCDLLEKYFAGADLHWGWKKDGATGLPPWVLYIEIPQGQVSFHSHERFCGPDYQGQWDGIRGASEERILGFCDVVLGSRAKPVDTVDGMDEVDGAR